MKNTINLTGYVRKEETVSCVKSNVLNNTFVLHINHPFPGYYGQEMVDMTHPRSILLITKKEETWERIIRMSKKINNYLNTEINMSRAKINLWNKTFYGIRAKGFKNYPEIHVVQRALQDEGVEFMASRRMKDDEIGLMTLKKFFDITEIENGIYMSTDRSDMAYVQIPRVVNWELFRKHTASVKNNISDSSYDVVSGAFYHKNEILDMLRIFKPNVSIELLREIKKRYTDLIESFKY